MSWAGAHSLPHIRNIHISTRLFPLILTDLSEALWAVLGFCVPSVTTGVLTAPFGSGAERTVNFPITHLNAAIYVAICQVKVASVC